MRAQLTSVVWGCAATSVVSVLALVISLSLRERVVVASASAPALARESEDAADARKPLLAGQVRRTWGGGAYCDALSVAACSRERRVCWRAAVEPLSSELELVLFSQLVYWVLRPKSAFSLCAKVKSVTCIRRAALSKP